MILFTVTWRVILRLMKLIHQREVLSRLVFRCFIEFLRCNDDRPKVLASLLYRLAVCVSNEMAGICFRLVGKSAKPESVSETGWWLLSTYNKSWCTVMVEKGKDIYQNRPFFEASPRNLCCRGKGIRICYSECVCVCSLSYAACSAHAPYIAMCRLCWCIMFLHIIS